MNIRTPDYSLGRFFVSPILGCTARCSFCYIFSNDYNGGPLINSFDSKPSLEWIYRHEHFRQGRAGSIISIGAWGDPFPRGKHDLHKVSVEWLNTMCKTGNPIQIMSRFQLTEQVIEDVTSSETYPGQILFSTSLSTLKKWKVFERGSDHPALRLQMLQRFSAKGIHVNVMIKPVIPGVTDSEANEIADAIAVAGIKYCVVGSLHWDQHIYESLSKVKDDSVDPLLQKIQNESHKQLMDCTTETTMNAFPYSSLDITFHALKERGLTVFKKSACVNSHILNEKNAVLLYETAFENFCVRCGVCKP